MTSPTQPTAPAGPVITKIGSDLARRAPVRRGPVGPPASHRRRGEGSAGPGRDAARRPSRAARPSTSSTSSRKRKTPVERLSVECHRRASAGVSATLMKLELEYTHRRRGHRARTRRARDAAVVRDATARSAASLAPDIDVDASLTLNGEKGSAREAERSGRRTRSRLASTGSWSASKRMRKGRRMAALSLSGGCRTATRSAARTRVDRVDHQLLLHEAPSAKEPRPHRSNGNVEHLGRGFVGLILDVHDQQRGAERLRDVVERVRRWPARGRDASARRRARSAPP